MRLSGLSIAELGRFMVTGALCVALNVAIVVVLTEYAGLHYLVSLLVCFVTVTLVGFVLNRRWTFRKAGGEALTDYRRYLIVTLINIGLSVGLCAFGVNVLGVSYPVTMVLVSIAFVPVSFAVHRHWTFKLPWRRNPPG